MNSSSKPQEPSKPIKKSQTIKTQFDRYEFADVGRTANIKAKATSGLTCKYKSSDFKVVSVDKNGKLTAKKSGTAKITISQSGNQSYKSESKVIVVEVPKIRGRQAALQPWYDALEAQIAWQKNAKYNWKKWRYHGCDVARSKYYGTCITFPSAALQRAGVIAKGAHVAGVTSPKVKNDTIKFLKKTPGRITTYKVKSNVKKLAKANKILPGDIVHSDKHTWVYMGVSNKHKGKYVAWESGNSKKNSNKAHKNYSKPGKAKIMRIDRINCFTIKTSCINGTITNSNLYMAGRNVKVTYTPIKGKKLKSVKVDGKSISLSKYKSAYEFKGLNKNHTVEVIFN